MNRGIQIATRNRELVPYKNALTMIKDAGFECVDIDIDAQTAINPDMRSYISSLREELDKFGLVCTQTHLPFYSLLDCCTKIDEDMEKGMAMAIEASAILGAKWGAYHPRTAKSMGDDWEISRKYCKESLKPLIETAEKFKVGIAVENIPIFPDCPQHRFFGSDPDDLCEIVDYFKSDYIGICWDTGHANLMSFDQAKVIRQLGHRIKSTHLQSNHKEQDWHLLPLFGRIDWDRIIKAFKDVNYSGDFVLEITRVHDRAAANYYKLAFDSVTILKDMFDEA